jgi:hypothetical protein
MSHTSQQPPHIEPENDCPLLSTLDQNPIENPSSTQSGRGQSSGGLVIASTGAPTRRQSSGGLAIASAGAPTQRCGDGDVQRCGDCWTVGWRQFFAFYTYTNVLAQPRKRKPRPIPPPAGPVGRGGAGAGPHAGTQCGARGEQGLARRSAVVLRGSSPAQGRGVREARLPSVGSSGESRMKMEGWLKHIH